VAPQLLAADNEATAKRLVSKLPADAQRPDYYTGKHGFMNDEDINTEAGALEQGLYLMSWLVTNPPVKTDAGIGGLASINKPFYEDFFGVKEEDVSANPRNWPYVGLKSKKPNDVAPLDGQDIYWIPMNFQDVVEAGVSEGFNSGNQFDWNEWAGGFRALDDFHIFIFCLVKWNSDTTVTLAAGSDDSQQTYVNGEKVSEGLGDKNWARDNERGEFTAKGGQWVAMFAELGERGGEAGYTLRVEPPPDDHTLDVESAQAVGPQGKLAATWGSIKVSY
jgi:hypothetical protein